jgi:hypothetical protein
MVIIRFPDAAQEKEALGYMAGRFSFKTWASGETWVPEDSLPHLAMSGFKFSIEGKPSYQAYAPLRDPVATPI